MINLFEDITFSSPAYLYALLLLPLAIIWYIFREKKQHPSIQMPDLAMFQKFGQSPKVMLRHLLFALRMLALGLLIVVLARPQTSSRGQKVTREGIDIVLALDVSGSMLARDLSPDRLEASKAVAANFIKNRPSDRMGLVVFSGETFTQVPLTTDHSVLLNMFSGIKSGMIEDGTAIGDGLATSVARLKDSEAVSKVIILLTDGMNNAGSVDPITAAEIARLYGIRVYTIGVGTYGEAPYPVQTPFGIRLQNMKVEIDEPLLQDISQKTNGRYFRATSNKELEEIYKEIDQMERSKIDVTEFSHKYEQYLPFAIAALLLILLETLLRFTFFRSIT